MWREQRQHWRRYGPPIHIGYAMVHKLAKPPDEDEGLAAKPATPEEAIAWVNAIQGNA